MGRPILVASLGVGLGLAGAASCQIPSTLGLSCSHPMHCDPGQICIDGLCEVGMLPPPGTGGGPMLPPMTGDGGNTTGGGADGDGSTSDAGSTTSAVADSSSEGGSSSSGVVPCGTTSCTDVDILIVLDTSDSMSQWLPTLANSLPSLFGFITEELDQVCSFHVGITTSDAAPEDNSPECQYSGAMLQRSGQCDGVKGDTPWWSNGDGDAQTLFDDVQCELIFGGTGGSDDEHMLDALMGAVDPANNAKGACNDGFRRPSANLIVLYLSDEDDPTRTGKQDDLAEQFQEWVDPDLVGFLGLVGDAANQDGACAWVPDGDEGTGAQIPTALNGFLALSMIPFDQRVMVDICQAPTYDFTKGFEVFETTCPGSG